MEELVRSIPKFGGAFNEDVVKWLHAIEEIFDQGQLQPSNKYIAVQSFLTKGADAWFRFNKSNILDWSTFQIEIVKKFQLSAPSKIYSTTTIPQKEKENENTPGDLIKDNQIKSFETLENKCLRANEPDSDSYMLVNINDPDPKIQAQYENVADDYNKLRSQGVTEANDCDELEQQHESDIKFGPVKCDAEDVFETIGEDSFNNTIVPADVPHVWSEKSQPPKPRVLTEVHADYDWNQSDKKHYDTTNSSPKIIRDYKLYIFYQYLLDKHAPPYEYITFNIVSKAQNYSYSYRFRYYSHNGIFQLKFSFRKWKYRRSTLFSFRKWKYRPLNFFCLFFIVFVYVFYFMLFFTLFCFAFVFCVCLFVVIFS